MVTALFIALFCGFILPQVIEEGKTMNPKVKVEKSEVKK